jgi:hypothetical protein
MRRFCVRCRAEISAGRVARGSCFCSKECRRIDKIERLRAKRGDFCRLCGRPFRRAKSAQGETNPHPGVETPV